MTVSLSPTIIGSSESLIFLNMFMASFNVAINVGHTHAVDCTFVWLTASFAWLIMHM